MHAMLVGFISGALSGIVMGLISHILFRYGINKRSLIIIDGSFLLRTLKSRGGPQLVAGAGLCVHLVTSGIFGALYFVATPLLGFDAEHAAGSFLMISLYVGILWLSMLFIALPIAGEGFLGARSGSGSWLEQLVLHGVFCVLYAVLVKVLL